MFDPDDERQGLALREAVERISALVPEWQGPWICSTVECRVCGTIHTCVMPFDGPHVDKESVTVHDVQCNHCGLMACDTIEGPDDDS